MRIVFLMSVLFLSCGKTKLDSSPSIGTSSTAATSSMVKCQEVYSCKTECDSNSKADCDYEVYKNWPNKFACDRLNNCYNKLVPKN